MNELRTDGSLEVCLDALCASSERQGVYRCIIALRELELRGDLVAAERIGVQKASVELGNVLNRLLSGTAKELADL